MPCNVKLVKKPFLTLKDNLASKPSGFKSGSPVTEVRCHKYANFPPVAENHGCAVGLYVMYPLSNAIVLRSKMLVRVSLVVVGSPCDPVASATPPMKSWFS